ncbi:MAG: hypothetical protein ACRDUV_13840 [Pseudonocardiaceae bacterium]
MMGNSRALVSAAIEIDSSTRISYHAFRCGLVEFSIGNGEFDLFATEPGLSNLVDRAQEALREVRIAVARDDESCAPE